MPSPRPVDETYRPSRISLSRLMPGPRSTMRATSIAGGSPSRRNSTRPPPRILMGVASNLGDSGGKPVLILRVEPDLGCELAGALPREHDVVLARQLDSQQRRSLHRRRHFEVAVSRVTDRTTTTNASSRPREKSRYNTPATTLARRCASPGYRARSHCGLTPSEWRTSKASGGQGYSNS